MERIIIGVDRIPESKRLTLLLGNFDGMHLGHFELVKDAKKNGEGELGVMLFDQNPAIFLKQKSPKILTSLEDKIRLFSSYGFDYVFILPLNEALLNVSKDDFILHYLSLLNPSLIVVGEDYTFGKRGEGNAFDLKKIFKVDIVPLKTSCGVKIGTQEIIGLLNRGEIEEANALLGRNYEIHGKVVNGFHNGTSLGFPTANLSLSSPYVIPRVGVYKTISYIRGVPHLSMTNIGNNPTLGLLLHPTIETFVLNFHETIYEETMYLDFISFLREEKKFSSLDELKEQLRKDVASLYL